MSQVTTTLTSLGDLPVAEFLRHYWQRKPLLVRNAIDPQLLAVNGDELAGLALEDDVESRIIIERDNNWQLHNGPFSDHVFAGLPDSHWTLLVQAVDHYLPEVRELLDLFRFVPNWRLDDIMISYAVAGGSVGPHFDQYDVFLLQGQGQRRWQLGQQCDEHTQLKPDTPLCLIDNMQVTCDWLLNPGDLLYIPPGLSHFGVAVDNCVTYSVGFRSPSAAEAYGSLADHLTSCAAGDTRYSDSGSAGQAGEIRPEELNGFVHWLHQQLQDQDNIAGWFGREMTRGKYDDYGTTLEAAEAQLPAAQQALNDDQTLCKTLDSRWAFIATDDHCARLFVAGCELQVSLKLAQILCAKQRWTSQELRHLTNDVNDQQALLQLITAELIYPES